MNNDEKIFIASLIMIGISLILGAFSFLAITENNNCVSDPFRYTGEKLKEAGGNYFCSCNSLSADLLDFTFDENGTHIVSPYYESTAYSENITYKGGLK